MGPIDAFRLWTMYRKDRALALTEVIMEGQTKPGWKTTEFWMTILVQVPVVLGVFLGATNPITIGIGAAATIAYTLSRAWNKGNVTAVAMAALQAAAEKSKELPAPAQAAPAQAAPK